MQKTAPHKVKFAEGAKWGKNELHGSEKAKTDFKWHFDILLNFNSCLSFEVKGQGSVGELWFRLGGQWVSQKKSERNGYSQVVRHANEMQRNAFLFFVYFFFLVN